MEETKQNESKAQEQPSANAGTGNIEPTASLLERADSIAKRLEEANKASGELLAKHEAVLARIQLSGRSDAGQPQKSPQEIATDNIRKEVETSLKKYKVI